MEEETRLLKTPRTNNTCSSCGTKFGRYKTFKFCPECGANLNNLDVGNEIDTIFIIEYTSSEVSVYTVPPNKEDLIWADVLEESTSNYDKEKIPDYVKDNKENFILFKIDDKHFVAINKKYSIKSTHIDIEFKSESDSSSCSELEVSFGIDIHDFYAITDSFSFDIDRPIYKQLYREDGYAKELESLIYTSLKDLNIIPKINGVSMDKSYIPTGIIDLYNSALRKFKNDFPDKYDELMLLEEISEK